MVQNLGPVNFHHHFSKVRGTNDPFAPAIAQRYKFLDARLGELLASFKDPVNVILVSDHGWDFDNHHHIDAPPGIFFAHGPAFEGGRRIDALSIYDIAPMCLHLLGLPLAEDMAGTSTAAYRAALAQDFAATHDVGYLPTYESATDGDFASPVTPVESEVLRQLKGLGYIK